MKRFRKEGCSHRTAGETEGRQGSTRGSSREPSYVTMAPAVTIHPVKFELLRNHEYFFSRGIYIPYNVWDIFIVEKYLLLSEIQI